MPVSLIVPVNVQALCVGAEDVNGSSTNPYGTIDFAQVAANFANLPWLNEQNGGASPINQGPCLSQAVLPELFQTVSPPLPSGIHVHWSLPKALAQAQNAVNGTVQPRLVPNRWLVVRIASNHADSNAPVTSVMAWAIESDALWNPSTADDPLATNALSITTLLNPLPNMEQAPNQPFLTVGRAFLYSNWPRTPADSYATPHTAFGYGELSYAAAYALAPNVFGMYDTLADLDLNTFPPATTNISYMVAGWYADLDDDPLAQLVIPPDSTYQQVLALIQSTFGWTFTADESAPLPGQVICNGLLTGITWNPQNKYLQTPDQNPITVAVGNTTAEALSALLAGELPNLSNVEGVLNALQLGLLQRLSQPDGQMEIEESVHQAEFASSSAGTLWVIKPATPGNTNNGQPVKVTAQDLLNAASSIEMSLPGHVGDDLNQLNLLQQQADELAFQIESSQKQIFADWSKYMMLEYSAVPPPCLINASDALNYINTTLIDGLNTLVNTTLPAAVTAVGVQAAKIRGELSDSFLLTTIQTPRYWTSVDPVVLLSGQDLAPFYTPQDPANYDTDGNLLCRIDPQLIAQMQVSSPAATVTAAQLPQLPPSPNQTNAAILAALTGEAFFLDYNQAWLLAAAADGPSPGDLWETIQAAQRGLFSAGPASPVTFDGQAPAPLGFQVWSSPWIPLLMQWEANYYPWAPIDDETSPASYDPGFITTNFQLNDDGIDLAELAAPAQLPPVEIYQGSALLTHNVEINIVNQINTFLQNYPDDPSAAELRQIAAGSGLPMMAQALGGLHQGLLMRKQLLQLPVFDPLAILNGMISYNFSNSTIPTAVGSYNDTAPMPLNAYNPLRAGFMQISRIWLVDVFGQKIEIAPSPASVVRASSLIPAFDIPANPLIGLPPRVTQPSRLLFRWLSADNDAIEMNSDPATTPVCGWVLFNRLDDNLMIYDASGDAMGSLNMRGPLWSGAPGPNYGQPIDTVFAGANPHLSAFALGIYNNPDAVNFLTDLLAAIDATVTLVNPQSSQQFQATSVLIGRPLAIVRASLSLDLQGLPAINQSWTELAAAAQQSQTISARDNAGFPTVQFPVRLGDLANINDGLIGYFMENGAGNAYQTFYAPASTQVSNGVVPPGPNTLLVSVSGAPVTLSILLDPRASIHATAGILPVKQIQIPPYMFSDALANMAVTFLTAPVISAAAQFSLPLPKEDGYSWNWLSMDPQTRQWTTSSIAAFNPDAANLTIQQISEGWLQLVERLPTKGRQ